MDSERRDYVIGIILLLIVVLEWTGSGFLTQGLFNEGYEKPFLVTYLNTSAFALYLVPFLFRYLRNRQRADGEGGLPDASPSFRSQYDPLPNDASADATVTYISSTTPFLTSESRRSPLTPDDLPPLTTRETAQLASIFCFFWFVANWSVNASLDYTSVASSTILSSMSGFFTLGVGRMFGVELFTLWKFGAVLISCLGVLLVSLEDSNVTEASVPLTGLPSAQPANSTISFTTLFRRSSSLASVPLLDAATHPSTSNPILGDFYALLSALFYALYVTLLKARIRNESRVNMQLFFGFVGVINMVTLWPVGFILHFTGIETFQWPTSSSVWTVIVINMFITLSSDYIYLIAMLKTTPLVVTIGLSLTIPVAVIGDWTILSIPATWQTLIGATLVIASFIALGIEGSQSQSEESSSPDGVVQVPRAGYEGLGSTHEEADGDDEVRGRSPERRKSLTVSTNTTPRVMTLSVKGMVSRSPDMERQRRVSGDDLSRSSLDDGS
ncbi:hypothetical protein FRB94_014778 [Tulasnella sp. JGI-2019a]|nr:hypothetical protein FRB93_002922 [Tulasnella sp. JGI-2019a]KAG9006943.1 hypothetical protein FRB94_014778 [Tulasnella sp. JGI-2019a]